MKKLLLFSTALLLIITAAHAQSVQNDSTQAKTHRQFNKQWAHHGMQQRGRNAMAKINLTDTQKQQMKQLNTDYHQQLAALEKNDQATLADYKTKLAALRKDHREKMQHVFTAEQKTQMAQMKQKAAGRMRSMSAARLEKMKTNLALTDDQMAKIKSQREDLKGKLKSLREDQSMLPEQRREQVKTLMQQQRDAFKSVLTQDQLDKMKSMHKQRETSR